MVKGTRSNASTSEAGEEVRGGLVRRQIVTKKGNRVWRWVKPGNVGAPPEDNAPRGLGLAAARAARRTKVVVPPPQEAPKESPKRFCIYGLAGCCGARIAFMEPPSVEVPVEKTVEEKRKDYEATGMYQTWLQQTARLQACTEALQMVAEGKTITGPYRGYDTKEYIRYIKDDLRIYEAAIVNYSFETYLVKGDTHSTKPTYFVGVAPQNGIVVSVDEFPGSTQTSAGLWVRCDYKFNFGDRLVKTPDAPAKKPSIKPTETTCLAYAGYYETLKPIYMAGRQVTGGELWGFIKKEKYQAGDIVVFIRTDRQMSAAAAEDMAQSGFHCCLVTGNRNHPKSSILYLYERKLTDDDIKALNKKAPKAK